MKEISFVFWFRLFSGLPSFRKDPKTHDNIASSCANSRRGREARWKCAEWRRWQKSKWKRRRTSPNPRRSRTGPIRDVSICLNLVFAVCESAAPKSRFQFCSILFWSPCRQTTRGHVCIVNTGSEPQWGFAWFGVKSDQKQKVLNENSWELWTHPQLLTTPVCCRFLQTTRGV